MPRRDIEVEVVFALPLEQRVVRLTLPVGTTVQEAIVRSEVILRSPQIDWTHDRVGIHGRVVGLDTPLRDDDRVEIYRALTVDPKEARRRRVVNRLSRIGNRRNPRA